MIATMAANVYDRRVHYEEFVQRVRRHAPSSLLPIVAKAGALYGEPDSWMRSPYRKLTPWALAEIARVSINSGNEHRSPATDNDLMQCCAAYDSIQDPDLRLGTLDGLAKFMLRMASQQLSYQFPALNELVRSIALYEHTVPATSLRLGKDWGRELLGCSLSEYVGVAFLFYVGALRNDGAFDLSWISQPHFACIREEVSAEVIQMIALDHFVADRDRFRSLQPTPIAGQHRDTQRFQFNPLNARPVVSGFSDMLLIPVPLLLIRKAGPLGIYYMGCQKWGNTFTQDLGPLFESYVGDQLRLQDNVTVLPAILYGRDNRASVDWIVLYEEVTLLVEVKSTRPTEAVRVGSDSAAQDLRDRLKKAVGQINVATGHIRGRHRAFSEVPHDVPIIGLIVTMEPFDVINAPIYRRLLPDSTVPVRVCAASELEQLVTIRGRSVGNWLAEFVDDPAKQDWSVGSALAQTPGVTFKRNDILDRAFATLPWNASEADVASD